MSLIIATGSNLGDSIKILGQALLELQNHFELLAQSRIYKSQAVDYEAQPDFFNQALEFKIPNLEPEEALGVLLSIEKSMGRTRDILRGPRTIDLDIIFWNMSTIQTEKLTVPHPRWQERSFIVKPLSELPFFQTMEKCFTIPSSFKVDAFPV